MQVSVLLNKKCEGLGVFICFPWGLDSRFKSLKVWGRLAREVLVWQDGWSEKQTASDGPVWEGVWTRWPLGIHPKFNQPVIYSHRGKTAWYSVVTIISAASGSFPDFEDNQQGLATAVLCTFLAFKRTGKLYQCYLLGKFPSGICLGEDCLTEAQSTSGHNVVNWILTPNCLPIYCV